MSGARALHGGALGLACEVRRLVQAVSDWENRQAEERAASAHKEAQRILRQGKARDQLRFRLMAETLVALREHGPARTNELAEKLHMQRSLLLRILKAMRDQGQVITTGSEFRPVWEAAV
jgi:hypothetical protein